MKINSLLYLLGHKKVYALYCINRRPKSIFYWWI